MKIRFKRKTFLTIFMFFALVAAFMVTHEQAHMIIYEEYGCDTEVGFTFAGAYVTGTCILPKEELISLSESQAYVEAVGYQMTIPVIILAAILLFPERKERLI